jgi:hypothetical protein
MLKPILALAVSALKESGAGVPKLDKTVVAGMEASAAPLPSNWKAASGSVWRLWWSIVSAGTDGAASLKPMSLLLTKVAKESAVGVAKYDKAAGVDTDVSAANKASSPPPRSSSGEAASRAV